VHGRSFGIEEFDSIGMYLAGETGVVLNRIKIMMLPALMQRDVDVNSI
jgi:hypothetical protein